MGILLLIYILGTFLKFLVFILLLINLWEDKILEEL